MVKFRIVCPDCGTETLAASPQALVWEFCSGCGSHIWDLADVLMAEVVPNTIYFYEAKAGMAA